MSSSYDLACLFEELLRSRDPSSVFATDSLKEMLDEDAGLVELRARISEQLQGDPDKALLLALRSMAHLRQRMEKRWTPFELVATQPGHAVVPMRHTAEVVRGMIRDAREEIVVAGYAITRDGGLPDLLREAASTLRRIVVLCHSWRTDNGTSAREAILHGWPNGLARPQVHEYTGLDEQGIMHMKTLIVDAREILVTSANFTRSGMHNNMEFGVHLNGPAARDARAFFEAFMHSGHFRRDPSAG